MFVLWMINLSDMRAAPDFGKLENKGQSSKASSWKIGAIRPFGPKSPKSSESTGHGFPLLTSNFLGTSQTITLLAVQFFHEISQFFDVSENSQNRWFSDSDLFSKNQNWRFLDFLKEPEPSVITAQHRKFPLHVPWQLYIQPSHRSRVFECL